MSFYVVFPAHLVEELLKFLPADERPVYAERFEPTVGDLVWLRDDAESAVLAALEASDNPQAAKWRSDAAVRRALANRLMKVDNDALVGLVHDGLATLVGEFLAEMLVEYSRRNE